MAQFLAARPLRKTEWTPPFFRFLLPERAGFIVVNPVSPLVKDPGSPLASAKGEPGSHTFRQLKPWNPVKFIIGKYLIVVSVFHNLDHLYQIAWLKRRMPRI